MNTLKLIAHWKNGNKPLNTRTYDDIPLEERDNNHSWWYLYGKLTDIVGHNKATTTNCKSGGFSKDTINWSEISGNIVTSLDSDIPTSQICIDGIVDVEIEGISEPCIGYFWTVNNKLIYWNNKPYDYWEQIGLVCLKSDLESCKYAESKYNESKKIMDSTTIQELEKQLQEAKQKEAWEELQEECKKMCDLYKGKAYGSCALRYNNINKYFHDHLRISIQYFQDIYISGPNPDKIKISTFDDYKKFSPYVGIRYETEEITIFKNSTTIDIHSAKYDLKKPDTGLRYTIDLKVYQNLKNIMSSKIDSVFQESLHHINFSDIGTYSNEEILKKQGCRLIELSDEELYLLTSENHPFIYGKNLLVIDISIDILKNMLRDFQKGDAMDKDMYICGERIRRSGFFERKIKTLKTLLERL